MVGRHVHAIRAVEVHDAAATRTVDRVHDAASEPIGTKVLMEATRTHRHDKDAEDE